MLYFWHLFEFFLSGIEVWLLYFFCTKFMENNEKYKRHHIVLGGLSATFLIFIQTYIEIFSIWKTILCFFILLIFIFVFFSAKVKDKILNVIVFYVVLALADILGTILVTITSNKFTWNDVLLQGFDRIFVSCIAKITTALVITIIIRKRNEVKDYLPNKYWLIFIFLFSVLLCVILLLLGVGFSSEKESSFNMVLLIIIMAMLLIYFSTYYLFCQMSSNYAKISEMNLLEFQNEAIEKYLIQSQEYSKIIRILSHDLKHSLSSWKHLSEDNGHTGILNDILEFEQIIESKQLIDVENEIANAVVNQKLMVARKNEIQLNVRGVIGQDVVLSKLDLCSLLGNILDNAIEASLKVHNVTTRIINFTIKREGYFLLMEISNNYEIKPIVVNDKFLTIKKNRTDHGIGMISIERVVFKYQGAMKCTYDNHVFKTNIMLKAYDAKLR